MKITKAEYYWYIWVIDQACLVKMARYWPSSFFACLWTEMESRSINTQKKEPAKSISSHLDRTSLVNKGFIMGEFFLARYGGLSRAGKIAPSCSLG